MSGRTLVLLRHAKSARPDGVDDADRPLAGRGRRDAPVAGRWLGEHVPGIEAVVCSPALRTLRTWQLVAPELGGTPTFRTEPRIYGASVWELVDVVRGLPSAVGTALLIGHDPGLSELVAELAGQRLDLKTSSIAVLRGDGEWSAVGVGWAELVDSAQPRG